MCGICGKINSQGITKEGPQLMNDTHRPGGPNEQGISNEHMREKLKECQNPEE